MKISTKGRYALRMLADIAAHRGDGYIALKTIADRQEVSKKYLEQIVPVLTHGGLLITNRGHQGGYMLARKPEDITVGEILRLTEGGLEPVACMVGDPTASSCPRNATCPTLPVWQGLYETVTKYLDGITLADVSDNLKGNPADNYVI